MKLLDRVDEAQRDRAWLAFPVAVVKKFSDDSSGNLAVLITYYTFFSVFPLLLALASILGFVLHGHPSWEAKVEQSALSNFPLIGKAPLPKSGSIAAVVIGTALALYSGLGVAKAAQNAWNTIYCVPEPDRPGFLASNLRALRLVMVGGLGMILTTIVAGIVTSGSAVGIPGVGWGFTILGVAVAFALNTLLFTLVFRWLTVRPVTLPEVLPGAALAAAGLAILQAIASAFISHKLKSARATYGSFGTVIVLLSWFYLQSQVVLLAGQVNVVRQDKLWPRRLRG